MNASNQSVEVGSARMQLLVHPDGRFAVVVDVGCGPNWTASFGPPARIVDSRVVDGGLEFRYLPYPGASVPGHGDLAVTVQLKCDRAASETHCAVTLFMNAPDDYPMSELLGPVLAPRSDGSTAADWRFLVPDGEGLWLRGDGTGPGQRPRVTFHDHRVTLPMTALVCDTGASLLVTAVEGHDHAVDLHPGKRGEQRQTLPSLSLIGLAAAGQWGYGREWRVVSSGSGGVAAVAARVSDELRRGGLELRSQSSKLCERGVPERLWPSVGGTVLWCHFDTLTAQLVADLQAAELRSVMLMGRAARTQDRAALAASGYASGPYFQTYDVFPPGSVTELGWRSVYPPEGASDGWPDSLIRDMAGWLDPGWVYLPFPAGEHFWDHEQYLADGGTVESRPRYTHNQLPVRSYRRCPTLHREVLESKGLPMLDAMNASAVFYDIAAAMWGLECYSPEHPCDRRQDIRHRRGNLEALASTGRVLHSEAGKWWALDTVNGFEGLLSYDQELGVDNMQLTDYPEDLSRRANEFDLQHRVPLFGMVARHAVTRTLWWGTGQDRHVATQPAKDAFTALFGANPIFVVDPDHPLLPGSARWTRFVRTSAAFDLLRDLTWDSPISSFEVDGSHIGRTVFGTGASVEANVGFETEAGLQPGEFIIRDAANRVVASVSDL